MRDHLLGYLLQALENSERELVEEQLTKDPQLRHELDLLHRSLEPLRADRGHYDPPGGLAQRTVEFVAQRTSILPFPSSDTTAERTFAESSFVPGRWSMADLVVAAGIFLAASMLFFPALRNSQYAARLSKCQDNLRQLGVVLAEYSGLHDGYFPAMTTRGNFAAAGVYGPRLLDNQLLDDPQRLICPSSPLADNRERFRPPTLVELSGATRSQLAEMHRRMGGSYGYTLGYMSPEGKSPEGRYRPTKNLQRENFALMADAPSPNLPHHQSANHGGRGQNVLFEAGNVRVRYLTTCKAKGCNDDIYTNDDGQVAAGTHLHDSVIGASADRPIPWPDDASR